jgi:hypothetical protein
MMIHDHPPLRHRHSRGVRVEMSETAWIILLSMILLSIAIGVLSIPRKPAPLDEDSDNDGDCS